MTEFTIDNLLKEDGPVALIIKQHLKPVDCDDPVIFPPSYPLNTWKGRIHTIQDGDYRVSVELPPDNKLDKSNSRDEQKPGYNIDRFTDGTNICEIDSPQSQSNRIEPKFKTILNGTLVPQIIITIGNEKVNLLDVGHRAGDAVVRFSSMAPEFHKAFRDAKSNNYFTLATLAPTSLVFGVWDSRSTYVKIQRVIKSQIRATNVLELSRSAQYTPAVNYVDCGAIDEEIETGRGEESNFSKEGMLHALSTQTIGGVRLTDKSSLIRTVNLNLEAIKMLKGATVEQTNILQKYILGLALYSAIDDPDLNLREGCNLVFDILDGEKNENHKLIYRSKPSENFNINIEDVRKYIIHVKESFFNIAMIPKDKIDHKEVVFEKNVAENFLSRTSKDRDDIRKLGPITKEVLAKYDAKSEDPFKKINEEIKKNVKKEIGKKPRKGYSPVKNIEAFQGLINLLSEMIKDLSLSDQVKSIYQKMIDISSEHDDSHEAISMIEKIIKEFKKNGEANENNISEED